VKSECATISVSSVTGTPRSCDHSSPESASGPPNRDSGEKTIFRVVSPFASAGCARSA